MINSSHRSPTLRIHDDEIIVDNFAGGGGASLGIEWALGRSPDIAVNHDPEAVVMHQANHPRTRHLCGDVWDVRPKDVCGERRVGLAWFSPDCTFHSKAKGGKPVDREKAEQSRGLAWVVNRWAREVKPRVIILENVEEFEKWGPLGDDGRPDKLRAGLTFRRWLGELRAAGYEVEMRQLRAHDYGAPTIRKRLFIIARSDGQPIIWPEATHGPGRGRDHRTAAECIQWEVPCPSIFGRKKPLCDKTLKRIARGVMRFVVEAPEPFIVPNTHGRVNDSAPHGIFEPVRTITAAHRGELSLISPSLVTTGYGERPGQAPRCMDIQKPLTTVIAGGRGGNGNNKHNLVAAFLAKHYGGHESPGGSLRKGISTITTQDHHHLVLSHMLKLRGTCLDGQPIDRAAPTVTARGTHLAEVRTFLAKYYGQGTGQAVDEPLATVRTKDCFGLVYVHGEPYHIADIGQRMLQPRELFRAQGFPDSYAIDLQVNGRPLSKTAQIRMCGNSVCPPIAAALVRANVVGKEVVAA